MARRFAEIGAIVGAAFAGFADTHSAAVSIASLVASGKMGPADAISPILAALSTNTICKIIVAWTGGRRAFALRLIPGLLLIISAAMGGRIRSAPAQTVIGGSIWRRRDVKPC